MLYYKNFSQYSYWIIFFALILIIIAILLNYIYSVNKISDSVVKKEKKIYNEIIPTVKKIDQQVSPAISAASTIASFSGNPEIGLPLELVHAGLELVDYIPNHI